LAWFFGGGGQAENIFAQGWAKKGHPRKPAGLGPIAAEAKVAYAPHGDGNHFPTLETNLILMNKIIPLALFAGGLALIYYGVHATDSVSSDFSRFFTHSPTEKSIWLLIGGIVLTAIGAGSLMRGTRSL